MTQHTGERRIYVVPSGPERPIAIDLLTYLFLGMSALYVVLTFVFRPFGFPLSPWEFIYVSHVRCPLLWFYYILSHPYFAILWGAFVATAAIQFSRLREWGRRALELVTGLVLLAVPMAFFGLVLLFTGADSMAVAVLLAAALLAGLVLFILCAVIYRALGSPKVRAAMIDRPRRG